MGSFPFFSVVTIILVAREDLQAGFVSNTSRSFSEWKVKIMTLNALMVQMQIVIFGRLVLQLIIYALSTKHTFQKDNTS